MHTSPFNHHARFVTAVAFAVALLGASVVHAEGAPVERPRPFFVHTNVALNAFTYLAPLGTKPGTLLTPATRAILFEQAGFGYFFDKHFRAQLTLQFGETLTNTPEGVSPLTLGAVLPLLVFVEGSFWVAVGPALAFQSSGVRHFDLGEYVAVGWAFQLGNGISISPIITHLGLYYQRVSLGVSPSVSLAYRF